MAETYLEIQQQIAALQARAVEVRKAEVAAVIADIKSKIKAYGITGAELGFGAVAVAKPVAKSSATPKTPAPPKYKDPASEATWSGKGRKPRWILAWETARRSLDELLITRV